jgi:hypothetical protein
MRLLNNAVMFSMAAIVHLPAGRRFRSRISRGSRLDCVAVGAFCAGGREGRLISDQRVVIEVSGKDAARPPARQTLRPYPFRADSERERLSCAPCLGVGDLVVGSRP